MKIIRFPEGYPAENLEYLRKKFQEEYPNEQIILISDVMDIIDLSVQDLYKLRDMIDKEISDRELMIPGERNKP